MPETGSLRESLRHDAGTRLDVHGFVATRPETLVEAANEIDRLMRVYAAAADLVDDPFGSLDQRKFYALRESFYPTRDE